MGGDENGKEGKEEKEETTLCRSLRRDSPRRQGGKAAPLLPSLSRPSTAAFFHCWLRDRDRERIESERI